MKKRTFFKQTWLWMVMLISLLLWIGRHETAFAKDFGVLGNVYQISESDILKVIEQRLAKVDMGQLNKEMADKTRSYAERPTEVKNITTTKKTTEYFYDPTYTLKENIIDQNGKIIHFAGTKVNPLSHVPMREALIFIDGDDKTQVDLALKIRAEKQNKFKIILVKGSPLELQRKHKIWIYFDQAGIITTKLGIKEVPALVEQDGLELKILIIGDSEQKNAKTLS